MLKSESIVHGFLQRAREGRKNVSRRNLAFIQYVDEQFWAPRTGYVRFSTWLSELNRKQDGRSERKKNTEGGMTMYERDMRDET